MKGRRLLKIKQLIAEHEIETQEQLLPLLHEAGFQVTQATVSRDINELRLIKIPIGEGRYKYAMANQQRANPERKLKRALIDHFVHIDAADNLVVMKCLPGTANAIGALIDNMSWSGLLGTICGDDTILLICRSTEEGEAIIERIFEIMGE